LVELFPRRLLTIAYLLLTVAQKTPNSGGTYKIFSFIDSFAQRAIGIAENKSIDQDIPR